MSVSSSPPPPHAHVSDHSTTASPSTNSRGVGGPPGVARPACMNPPCVAGGRASSHIWAECRSEGGPLEVKCKNSFCVSRGVARGHYFQECRAEGGGMARPQRKGISS